MQENAFWCGATRRRSQDHAVLAPNDRKKSTTGAGVRTQKVDGVQTLPPRVDVYLPAPDFAASSLSTTSSRPSVQSMIFSIRNGAMCASRLRDDGA